MSETVDPTGKTRRIFRRPRYGAVAVVTLLSGLAAGCGYHRNVGFVDRCADAMAQAFPQADLDITGRSVTAETKNTVLTRLEATRDDAPPTQPSSLTAECRFEEGVLTAFRWTTPPTR